MLPIARWTKSFYYVRVKGRTPINIRNPPGFFKVAVSNCFLAETFGANRRLIAEAAERECAQEARTAAARLHQEREEGVTVLRMASDDEFASMYSNEDRGRARAVVHAALADPALGDEDRAILLRLLDQTNG